MKKSVSHAELSEMRDVLKDLLASTTFTAERKQIDDRFSALSPADKSRRAGEFVRLEADLYRDNINHKQEEFELSDAGSALFNKLA